MLSPACARGKPASPAQFLTRLTGDALPLYFLFAQTVISPHNYFLYTPLLPSVTVGTLEARSIIQPTRFITRHMKRTVNVIEAEAREVDPHAKTVTFVDNSDVKGEVQEKTIPYDYLVYALGCDNQTFGMQGVPKYACFLKELADADKVRTKLMDCEFLVARYRFGRQMRCEMEADACGVVCLL